MPPEIKPASHLFNLLLKTKDHHPNFSLLLGAGASVESGIKTGQKLVEDWRKEYSQIQGITGDAERENFLEKQRWYKEPEEYSILFEKLFDQPSLRREFIESLIKDANPSWGYIYLVNLIRKNVFNTVFTTNFDDLLNEACYLFSTETRPIVCAHDSSISAVRIFSKRPKIIKLHGDFLFDSIKNTVRELENLEENMRDKFRQCAGEFGLIVVGYGGNDRTIMDTLDALLRNGGYFPHGVYWCIRGGEIPPRVEELSRFSSFHLIQIEGFDDFFATLNSKMEFGIPIQDPYTAIRDRLSRLVQQLPVFTPWQEITSPLQKDIQQFCQKLYNANDDELITNDIRAFLHYRKREFAEAVRSLLDVNSMKRRRSSLNLDERLDIATRACIQAGDKALVKIITEAIQSNKRWLWHPGVLINPSIRLIDNAWYDEAAMMIDMSDVNEGTEHAAIHFVNQCQIRLHKKKKLRKGDIAELERVRERGDSFRVCCEILLGNEAEAVSYFDDKDINQYRRNSLLRALVKWPIFKLLSDERSSELKSRLDELNDRVG